MDMPQAVTLLLYLALLVALQRPEQWRWLHQSHWLQRLLLGTALALLPLWLLQAGIEPGLEVHVLGLTTATLVLGWRLALVAGSLTLVTLTLFGVEDGAHLGANGLFGILVPVLVTEAVRRLAYLYLPRHLFVYFFVCGFFCGALTLVAKMLSMAAWFHWGLGLSAAKVLDNYLVLMPLLAFPEALLNGMAVTLLAVYRPNWLKDFHDSDYLGN
ncbi:energy-coupling factor ABC transporter permease [Gallaecimonas sp. GXIMD4217]|uniref:energy-coupling factor ABC transporter permease n=1 Tax=Gallaecimonas sp. GXIMD4217 TaxID=3131927 RepID=UPI00311ACD29